MLRTRFAIPPTEGPAHNIHKVIQWPLIEFVELQDPNLELEFYQEHRCREKKNYNGSELKISKDGYDNLIKMHIEIEKQTTESDRMSPIYDGDSRRGYACLEVLENQVG